MEILTALPGAWSRGTALDGYLHCEGVSGQGAAHADRATFTLAEPLAADEAFTVYIRGRVSLCSGAASDDGRILFWVWVGGETNNWWQAALVFARSLKVGEWTEVEGSLEVPAGRTLNGFGIGVWGDSFPAFDVAYDAYAGGGAPRER